MKIEFPELGFKGDRDYLHGTDIYESAIKSLTHVGHLSPQNIDLMFHRLVRTQLSAELCLKSQSSQASPPDAVLSFRSGGEQSQLRLTESGSPISARNVYDEKLISAASRLSIKSKSIELDNRLQYSSIEIIVALNKFLLCSLFTELNGKWLFVRLVSDQKLTSSKDAHFAITLVHIMANKFTKSTFTINQRQSGQIFFSLV